jgi:hypothetical protein
MGGNDLLCTYGVNGPDAGAAESAVGRIAAFGDDVLVGRRRLAGDGCRVIFTTIYDPQTVSQPWARPSRSCSRRLTPN